MAWNVAHGPVSISIYGIKESFVLFVRPSSSVPVVFNLHPPIPAILVAPALVKLSDCDPIDSSCSEWCQNSSRWLISNLEHLRVFLETCSLSNLSSSGVHLRDSADLRVDIIQTQAKFSLSTRFFRYVV